MTTAAPPIGQAVIPGDVVYQLPELGSIKTGNSFFDSGKKLIATKPGVLNQSKDGKLWIASRQKRYIPLIGEPVLGTIKSKHSENYEVDIGAPFTALLPVLAFEGATKRNRPNLKDGDLVYCRVETADRDIQPTLSCVDAAGRASIFGPLTGGHQCFCSSAYARTLCNASVNPPILKELIRSLQFDIAIGTNGRIWIDSKSIDTCIVVARAIEASEGMQEHEIKALVKSLLA